MSGTASDGSLALIVLVEWAGWIIFLGFIGWMVRNEQGLLKKHLREEEYQSKLTASRYLTSWPYNIC